MTDNSDEIGRLLLLNSLDRKLARNEYALTYKMDVNSRRVEKNLIQLLRDAHGRALENNGEVSEIAVPAHLLLALALRPRKAGRQGGRPKAEKLPRLFQTSALRCANDKYQELLDSGGLKRKNAKALREEAAEYDLNRFKNTGWSVRNLAGKITRTKKPRSKPET